MRHDGDGVTVHEKCSSPRISNPNLEPMLMFLAFGFCLQGLGEPDIQTSVAEKPPCTTFRSLRPSPHCAADAYLDTSLGQRGTEYAQ